MNDAPAAAGRDESGDPRASLRKAIYGILIALAVGQMAGKILAVNSTYTDRFSKDRVDRRLEKFRQAQIESGADPETLEERVERKRPEVVDALSLERPFLSANDRSRWLTVRSLVEEGTYEVDNFFRQPRWDSIDMVSHVGRDGEQHYYSSKPPLLATLVAGEYWIIHKLTGATLGTHPYEIGRFMIFTINIPLMVLIMVLVARLAEQLGTSDWGRIFVVAAAGLGTMLTTFSITLNNHIFGAAAAIVTLYYYVQIVRSDEPKSWHFLMVGLAAAFTVTNELPAAAFMALFGILLVVRDWRRTLLWGVPGVLVVAAGFFGTNYIAHQSFKPPYMHRSETDPADNWYHYTYEKNGRTITSYWQNRVGIDIGEPSKATYALHCLVGHHGIFSLTPMWLLTFGGIAIWAWRGGRLSREIALATFALTVVCLVFFIGFRPQMDRNYGGMTSGLRWMFWFAPLWLVTMLPMVDWMAKSKWARGFALVLLAFSVLSVNFPTWNPWTQPWIYQAMEHFGWL